MCIEHVWKVPFYFFEKLCSVERRKLCVRQCPGLCVGREQFPALSYSAEFIWGNLSTQCKATAWSVKSDSWIKIQDYSASAWKMQGNFIIPELEESQLSLKVIAFQSCPSKTLLLLLLSSLPLVGGTGLSESKIAPRLLFLVCWAPAVPCLAHWCDRSHLELVSECVRSSQSSPWSFQVLFPCTYPAMNLLSMPLLHTQILGKPVSPGVQGSCIWLQKVTPDNASGENRPSSLWPLYCTEVSVIFRGTTVAV